MSINATLRTSSGRNAGSVPSLPIKIDLTKRRNKPPVKAPEQLPPTGSAAMGTSNRANKFGISPSKFDDVLNAAIAEETATLNQSANNLDIQELYKHLNIPGIANNSMQCTNSVGNSVKEFANQQKLVIQESRNCAPSETGRFNLPSLLSVMSGNCGIRTQDGQRSDFSQVMNKLKQQASVGRFGGAEQQLHPQYSLFQPAPTLDQPSLSLRRSARLSINSNTQQQQALQGLVPPFDPSKNPPFYKEMSLRANQMSSLVSLVPLNQDCPALAGNSSTYNAATKTNEKQQITPTPIEQVQPTIQRANTGSSTGKRRGRPPGSKNKKGTLSSIGSKRNSKAEEKFEAAAENAFPARQFSFQQAQSTGGNNSALAPEAFNNMAQPVAEQMRMLLEQNYMNNWQEGRRMRKKPDQMGLLMEYFEQDPDWSYVKKIEIAARIGMTPGQVSKWNWEQRKKLGMSTKRKKKEDK